MKNIILFIFFALVSIVTKADDDFGYTSKPNCDMSKLVVPFSGSFRVGSFGSASYSIPIEVPMGVNGVQPNISIDYDSQAGNGLVGYGCNVTGFSSITRTSKTKHYDGMVTGLRFGGAQFKNWKNAFCLDGQRLLLKTTGDNNSEYEYYLENDVNTRIIMHANSGMSWEVILPDGTRHFYGEDRSSLTRDGQGYTLAWNICRTEDVHGNQI